MRKRWTKKELNILIINYRSKPKKDLLILLKNRTWCSIKHKAERLGLCHYTAEERFWKHVDKKSNNECWNWISSYDTKGYGQMGIDNKFVLAHRFSWTLHFGEIHNDLCVLHKCDNPKCVNPSHLFLGTRKDNMDDKVNKNRQAKGENIGIHKLTISQIKEIRSLKGKLSQRKIAQVFNVSHTAIGCVHRNETWVEN